MTFSSLFVRRLAVTNAPPRRRKRDAKTKSCAADYLTRSVRRASGFVLVGYCYLCRRFQRFSQGNGLGVLPQVGCRAFTRCWPTPEEHIPSGLDRVRVGLIYIRGCQDLTETPMTSQQGRHPSRIGNSTPRPRAKNHSAGAGVPAGRSLRCSRIALRGSSNSQRLSRRSSKRNTNAVTAPKIR